VGGRLKFHAAARRWLMGLLHREPQRKNWRQGVLTFPRFSGIDFEGYKLGFGLNLKR